MATLVGALLLTGATGCGADDDEPVQVVTTVVAAPEPDGVTATATPSTVDAAPEATAAARPTTVVDVGATASSGGVLGAGDFVDVTPAGDVAERNFQSPSGNIQCAFWGTFVECLVLEAGWSVPEDPDCELDWAGTELSLDDVVYAGHCRGDTFLTDQPTTLDYGDGWSRDPLACMSREDGITCSNSETGHGFRVSRNSYLVF